MFFSSCNSVQFHAELLNYIDIPVMSIHGKQKQQRRTAVFLEFVNAKTGVLLCTDVAARGLDIPAVDWIIQYDPPDDPKEYIHRVGRTARAGKAGQSLLFLQPSEMGMVYTLQSHGLHMKQFNFDVWFDNCVRESGPGHALVYAKRNHAASEVQAAILKTVEESDGLKNLAVVGFTSYCRSYATYAKELKTAFNVRSLHFGHVAKR